jgi:hypothetical protein
MKVLTKSVLAVAAFVGLSAAPACQPAFPGVENSQQLRVTITGGDVGAPDRRLPIAFAMSAPTTFTVRIEAIDANGDVDTSFNGYVRASAEPGAVFALSGPHTDGRNALLSHGVADGIQIGVVEAYGDARLVIEDVGYVPVDPLANPPPECANGIDDNHNGKIDYPTDPGCYAANDNTEDGGTYATAVSDSIYFEYPRIADVRGVAIGGSTTPFENQQVEIDTAWVAPNHGGGVVVTGLGASGFFATDLSDFRPATAPDSSSFTSVYAYTYTAPPIMLPCDRLITFGGTASEFFGFTEMNYPTWSLEEWDPTVRPCLVPDPVVYDASQVEDTSALIRQEAALVRVGRDDKAKTTIHVSLDFGAGLVNQTNYAATPEASDCDYNGDGKIDYTAGNPEDLCSTACTANPECTEYSGYLAESQFRIVVVTNGGKGSIYADATADATFNPPDYRGKEMGAFTGNLVYFSGGSTFTITARCSDDIVTDPNKPALPSSKACVVARNAAELTNAN